MRNLIITITLFTGLASGAQSGQTRVMLQQIAALKAYGNYLQKGYSIAREGLSLIGDMKNGELRLHELFFDGLAYVNPAVRNYPKVQGIFKLSEAITRLNGTMMQQLQSELFYGNERDYIRRIFERLLSGCNDDLETLRDLLTDTNLSASDAQRLSRIDALYQSIEERYSFTKSFYDECTTLFAARQHEFSDIRQMRPLHQLNTTP